MVSLAPFDYLHGIYENMGIVWLDAHPDVSAPQNKYPNAHAMVLGSLLGYGDSELSAQMQNAKFKADEILYVGLQELHDYQEAFLKENGVDYQVQTETFLSDHKIKDFCSVEHIVIHLDIDVLDAGRFLHLFRKQGIVGDGSGAEK